MRESALMRLVARTLIVTITAMPFQAIADEMADIGRQAQHYGKTLQEQMKNSQPSVSGGNLNLGSGLAPLNINDLFPGTSAPMSDQDVMSKYFPDTLPPNVNDSREMYDSGTTMDEKGANAQEILYQDANSANPSISGAAYKVLLDAAKRSRPNFANDPMLNQSNTIYEEMDLIAKNFGDCTTESTFNDAVHTEHVPEYEHCEQLNKPAGDCDISHEIVIKAEPADMVFLVDNSNSMDEAIDALKTSIGDLARLLGENNGGNLRLGGAVTRGNQYLTDNINLSSSISAFTSWVNHIKLNHGDTYNVDATNFSIDHFAWRDNVEKVIVIIGNKDNPNGNVSALRARLDALGFKVFIFHNNAGVQALGTPIADNFSATGLYKAAQFLTIVEDSWKPQACLEAAKSSLEEFCSGSYTQTVGSENDCINLSGFNVCPGDPIYTKLQAPPIPNVSKLALKVHVSSLQCNYNIGSMGCYTDANGNQQCPTNQGEQLSSCEALEANPQCGFISSKCVEGAQGSQGTCYVFDNTYDCGSDVNTATIQKTATYNCGGPIRCMGGDCLDISQAQNTEFTRAAALLNAAQFMASDMACTGQDANGNPTGSDVEECTIFKGNDGECKKAVGGVVNCCQKPDNVSFADYLTMIMAMPKLDTAIMSLDQTNSIRSSYQLLRDPITQGWDQLKQPFANYADNISGAVDTVSQTYNGIIQSLENKAKAITLEALKSVGYESGAGAAGAEAAAKTAQSAAEDMANTIVNQAVSVLSTVSAIYTAYTVSMLVIQTIYACTADELKLNVDRKLKKCSYVGSYCAQEILGVCIEKRESYCCFSSPLSRIIQEQAGPQLGQDFGSAKHPECGGLTMDQVAQIDWTKIDLDEWVGLLTQNGLFPNAGNVDLDTLTGAGNGLNLGNRANAEERAIQRLQDSRVDESRFENSINYRPATGAPLP
ncbi:conjugal transfer mating pair stabilization protein TraN [Azomonas macrocytogenes]|uniref:Conjugal transfer mating pair stabilization protein TraN n=1 Tax=Azomonas macrocytogenes TaxID=69962 RepID=A0A839T9N0_AZOMA|nr:conjugal transfer mating pair stabilization protein TraN [Azomonas macrocytogenes]MBB3105166.1 conjugal transfer mating pair stabilization protein TraN [Azomonas macrocytogenes]